MSTVTQKQILRAKIEAETSLANARIVRDQWLAATRENGADLAKKEVDRISKAFKNRLLTLKWDCEDLEELVNVGGNIIGSQMKLEELTRFIEECGSEIATFISQLENFESKNKIFNKHGIMLPNQTQTTATTATTTISMTTITNNTVTPVTQNSIGQQYERISDLDAGEIHFDKNQIEASTTIFNNALYDHYENEDRLIKGINAAQVFNNISRPATDVYMHPDEHEMILEMLETEYYNPPDGFLTKSRYNYMMRRLFDIDIRKILGTILLFPILFILFLL